MSRAAVANAWLEGYKKPSERAIEMARLYAEEKLTYQEIGDRYNISRERVRQLLVPFGLETHGGILKRESRERELRESYDKIMAGDTTTAEEAKRLGYAKPDYLRMAFWRLGLKLFRPAKSPTEQRQAARDRYLERVKRGPKKHGTVSGYKNFGCRCPRCKKANRLYEREMRSRRRQGKESEDS